jgi:hypothetical protein
LAATQGVQADARKPRKHMRKISMETFIRGEIGDFRPGMSFSRMSKFLGPPEWWEMANEDPFSGLLGYRDVQVELAAVESRLEVRSIHFKLWEFTLAGLVPKGRTIRMCRGIKIDLSAFTPGAEPGDVKTKLIALGVPFAEQTRSDISEVKYVIRIEGGAYLFFFVLQNKLALAEIYLSLDTMVGSYR